MRARLLAALLAGVLLLCARPSFADTVAQRFAAIAGDPERLEVFLHEMPKGGDLHNHLVGAIYAESFLRRAEDAGLCIDVAAAMLSDPPCSPARPRASDALRATPELWNQMVDAFSMRDFFPTILDRSGHDHFFAAFGKFAAATDDFGAMLAEEAARAGDEHVSYLEIMVLPELPAAIEAGQTLPWHGEDFAADLASLHDRLDALVIKARHDTDDAQARMRTLLHCGTGAASGGCDVVLRYQGFALRTLAPRAVFAQLAFAAMLAHDDPRYVGVNIVAPEDDPTAVADYTLHMRMLRFLHDRDKALHLSLHAGELVPGLVPPEALRSHIREAVEIAGAARIGHGVDVADEADAAGLLREMAARGVAVEINATSNQQILGVRGTDHPFGLYRRSGVPVVISTDDEGVSRIDMTHEYVHAALTWHLGYDGLKDLARASLAYSFLDKDDKARAQQRLEQEFSRFEQHVLASSP